MEDLGKRLEPYVPNRSDVDDLFRRGELIKAIRVAKRVGLPEHEIRSKVLSAARDMYFGCLAGVLLSAVVTLQIDVGYDAPTLLRRVYACHDYHGFLKHAERCKVGSDFAEEVERAIHMTFERGRVDEAAAWRRKFAYLIDEGRDDRPVPSPL